MDLAAYFQRIGFHGTPRTDLATLKALHRAHALGLSYENLDVQLGRPVTLDPEAAFDKIVRRGRGGWCYEMNGLLGAVLGEIGFPVTRLAGAAHRKTLGDAAIGSHLVLLVEAEGEPWIADVGFGDGPRDPFPLREGAFVSDGFRYRLERLDGDWWRLHSETGAGAPDFDFQPRPADPARLAEMCHTLQTSPTSPFVANAIAQRHGADGIRVLRGRVLRHVRPDGGGLTRVLDDAADLVAVLRDTFGLGLPEAAGLWPRICARHEQVFGVNRSGQPA